MADCEQPPGGLLHVDRPAALLDELHQTVGGIEPELHGERVSEHTFAVQRRSDFGQLSVRIVTHDYETELTAKPERRL